VPETHLLNFGSWDYLLLFLLCNENIFCIFISPHSLTFASSFKEWFLQWLLTCYLLFQANSFSNFVNRATTPKMATFLDSNCINLAYDPWVHDLLDIEAREDIEDSAFREDNFSLGLIDWQALCLICFNVWQTLSLCIWFVSYLHGNEIIKAITWFIHPLYHIINTLSI
jgi:hypothetical protein